MRVIHKYELPLTGWNEVKVSRNPTALCVHEQHERLRVWVEVDDDTPATTSLPLFVCGTGWVVPAGCAYLGTAFVGGLVWHVYREAP